eukprot:1870846-Rhodomonas_salina.2
MLLAYQPPTSPTSTTTTSTTTTPQGYRDSSAAASMTGTISITNGTSGLSSVPVAETCHTSHQVPCTAHLRLGDA